MATLEQRLIALAQAIGTDVKDLRSKQGDLTALSTTAKSNLVAAINEVYTLANSQSGGAQINDAAGDGATSVVWSANKVYDEISAAITSLRNELTAGANDALDTFEELASALNNDSSFASTVANGLANRVRFDAVQTLTAAQQLQACQNIGVGNYDADLAAAYATAKA